MPRKATRKKREVLREESPPTAPTPLPPDNSTGATTDSTVEDTLQVDAQSHITEADDASSQPKSKKSRLVSNLDDDEQENVALFLERNDFIYNKKRKDHTFVSKKNKAWEELAKEMGREVKELTTFFESIRTQIGKLRKKTSGQEPVEMTERQQWIWTRFQFLVPHIGQVIRRAVQSFRCDAATSQDVRSEEEGPGAQSSSTTISSTIIPESSSVPSSSRGARGRVPRAETLDEELHACKDRQEKLLQILQAPAVPQVPHPDRLKFAEYLGHAFQNLPQPVYREMQKTMFELLYNAEKHADPEVRRPASTPSQVPHQQYQQWQPDPSQWQGTSVAPARSVWHSQESTWVNRQFPGYAQSPSQQELARQRPSQTATYTTLEPPAQGQQARRSSGASASQDGSFSLSEYLMDAGPAADANPVTETPSTSTQFDTYVYTRHE